MRCLTLLLLSALTVLLCSTAGAAEHVLLNLAEGKPVTASGSQKENEAELAVDGDHGTRWCASDDSPGHWLQVDLQQPEDLTSCKITWEFDGVQYRYKIEGSPDSKAWTVLVDRTGDESPKTREQTHKLDAKGVRFIRVTVTGSESGRWPSFFEFGLYGAKTVDPATLLMRKNAALLREIKAPASLAPTIFAAPPNIAYPVALAAAPTGEVFVAVDPNGSLDQKTGRGKIIRCRDSNNDGAADEFITFTELDSPRGIVWDEANRTMYVQHPPFVRAYHDDNADGISDRNEVLVEGLGFDLSFRGADHTTNGMQIGIDGWLYIAVGDYGFVNAKTRDGKTHQLHGGGIVRVRPDGTRLEIVSRGQRNIYDVAISPTMDLFTRDNTNDGDGWDERLSHVVPLSQFGYPSLFKNFPTDTRKPLAEYGSGSPTGSLFLDEPGFSDGLGRGLYTCDWGTNRIDRHPLARDGASFLAGQLKFIEMPRPVDFDVDGSSRLYAASWRGGGFAYTGPDVGYVARFANPTFIPSPLLDLKKGTDKELLAELATDSHVRRLRAQRELVRRGPRGQILDELVKLTRKGSKETQAAAVFALAQMPGAESAKRLAECGGSDDVREFVLPALIDQNAKPAETTIEMALGALKSEDLRVRLQGVIGIARIGNPDYALQLLPQTAIQDSTLAHVAVEALVQLKAIDTCLAAASQSNASTPGAIRALQQIHDPAVVDGLIGRMNATDDHALRKEILRALCRLYYREADWTGGWWGTRPDTSGPYFQPVTWESSEKILKTLREALANSDPKMQYRLLVDLQRHKIDLPEATALTIKLTQDDLSFLETGIDLLATRPSLPADVVSMLLQASANTKLKPEVRAKALGALCRSDQPEARAATVTALTVLAADASPEVQRTRDEYVRDPRHCTNVPYFVGLSTAAEAPQRELGFAVLVQVAAPKQAKESADAAVKAIAAAWDKPEQAASLLRAIGRDKMEGYSSQVNEQIAASHASVKDAAQYAAGRLGSTKPAANDSKKTLIANIPYEQTLTDTLKHEGVAKVGGEIFLKQGCVACHTVSKNEPPKGPFLGGIAKRYSRGELIESIVKPNAKITQGFVSHFFVTKKRERIDGFIVRESADETELRTATGTSVIVKAADVVRKGTVPTSIMPEGLVGNLSPEELASLLAYLESLKAD
jgi:putative heme-binding domain-containing protein